jgi:drug/metabolite transporter (DMT)-like permease
MALFKFLYNQPVLQVFCGAFMISFSAVFVKLADVPTITSAFYRVFLGSLFLSLIYFIRRGSSNFTARSLPIVLFCGFAFALDLLFWHESIRYIGPGLATILGNFQVFILAGVGILFLGEKSGLRYYFSIPLAITGLILIVGFDWDALQSSYKKGIYFGLLTAVCYSFFLLSLKRIQTTQKHSDVVNLLLVSISSSIFLGTKMVCYSDSFAIPDMKSGAALLGLGLVSQTLGWLMIAHGLPQIRASFAGLILLIQPSFSFIWDVTIFNRPTTLLHWTGVVLTLAAIYLGISGKK